MKQARWPIWSWCARVRTCVCVCVCVCVQKKKGRSCIQACKQRALSFEVCTLWPNAAHSRSDEDSDIRSHRHGARDTLLTAVLCGKRGSKFENETFHCRVDMGMTHLVVVRAILRLGNVEVSLSRLAHQRAERRDGVVVRALERRVRWFALEHPPLNMAAVVVLRV